MKNSKAVYVTKRDLKTYNRDYDLYSSRVVRVERDSDEDYEVYKDFGCQYNSKRGNLICTCKRAHRRSVRYFRSPRQVYTTQERYPGWKSFTEIGVGSIKTLPKRRTRRIRLPETNDTGVGNSNFSLLFEQKKRHYETSYYDQKRTSSKCVGGVIETNTPLISKKISPIYHTQSCATSPIDLTVASKQVIRNTDTYKVNKNIVANIEYSSKRNSKTDQTIKKEKEDKPETEKTKTEAVQKTGQKSVETYTEKLEKDFSSDSLVQHVHNLENPSLDKQIRSSIDPMENKLEREYRKMFATKEESSLTKQSLDKPLSDLKSASILRRRFEALRKGLCKKEESKKDIVVIEDPSQKSVHSRKDVSIASDPPSLEPKSYSNTKIHSPYTSFTYPYKYNAGVPKKTSSRKKNDISSNWSTDAVDSDCQGVKGMLKLWGKKFNFEDENYKKSSPKQSISATKNTEKKVEIKEPEKVVEEKKCGKRFFFFGKRSSNKTKQAFKSKKGVTAGRCEVEDGLTVKIGAQEYQSQTPDQNTDSNEEEYDSIIRKSWLRRFLTTKVDSKRSVQIRWNNNMYATSSSTVFELLDCVYKHTDFVIKSKSDVTTGESSNYYAQHRQAVEFMQNNIQAWMIPKTIYPQYPTIDVIRDDKNRNIQVTYSGRKWYIDNSHCGNKIELVLRSKNFIKTGINKSSEYILIDIPKGYFTDSATLNDQSSDEEVYKITDYESNSYSFKRNKDKMDTGDHVSNVQAVVSAKDDVHVKSNLTETVVATPLQRDATVQGSQTCVPKHCDVIGVGIITQRELRDIKKPILKIQDDVTDSESIPNMLPPKKCEFAESYLQDYYRHWVPLGIDLFSWCVSDSQLRCSSDNNSQVTINNQGGDGSKSCPNMVDDYQTLNIVSSCNTSSCSRCFLFDEGQKEEKPKKEKKKFLEKFLKKACNPGPDGSRVSPKDSLEVFRKRRLYACGNKSNWNACHEPCSGESSQAKCESKDCFIHPCKPKKPSKKHVSIPDCETVECQKKSCVTVITSSGCETCNQTSACQMPPPPLQLPSNLPSRCPSKSEPPPPCAQPPRSSLKPTPSESSPCPNLRPKLSPCKPVAGIELQCDLKEDEPLPRARPRACISPPCKSPSDIQTSFPPKEYETSASNTPPCMRTPSEPPECLSPPCQPLSDVQTCCPSPPCETPPSDTQPGVRTSRPRKCFSPPREPPADIQTSCPSPPCEAQPSDSSTRKPPCVRTPSKPQKCFNPPREPPSNMQPCYPPPPCETPPTDTPPRKAPYMRLPCQLPPCCSPPNKPPSSRSSPCYPPPSCNTSPCRSPPCMRAPCQPPCMHSPCCLPPPCASPPCESPLCMYSPCMLPPCAQAARSPPCKPQPQKQPAQTSPPCSPPPQPASCTIKSQSFESISSTPPCKLPQKKQQRTTEAERRNNCRLSYVSTATSPITARCPSLDVSPPETPPQQKSMESLTSIESTSCIIKATCSPCTKPPSPVPISSPCRCYSQGSKCCSQGSMQRSGLKLQVPQKKKPKEKECSPKCPNRKKIAQKSPSCPPATPFPPKSQEITPEMLLKQISSKKRPCPNHCPSGAANLDTIRINSKENITINLKKQTPSTEEIRENLNIKVQDEDGRTLYERIDYHKHSGNQRHSEKCTGANRGFVPNTYRTSRIHRVSTTTCVNENLEKQDSDRLRSCSSLSNLIEINFTLKFKNCDKTAEVNVNNCGDKAEHATDTRLDTHNDVYCTTLQDEHYNKSIENINADKNDVNITILIKNYKPNEGKTTTRVYAPCSRSKQAVNFSENISQKFQTVATGYSEFNVENQAFNVHTTGVDLNNTIKKTESDKHCDQQLSEDLIRADELVTESCPSSAEHIATDNTVSSIKIDANYESRTDASEKFSKEDSLKNIMNSNTDKSETGVSFTDDDKLLQNTPIVTEEKDNKKLRKLRSRKEKKEMLKKLLEKAASVKTKNKEAVKPMKEMLQSILTSDSSCQEDQSETGNELIQELTYESLKPNYFRDTDSMNNYYNLDSTISEEKVNNEPHEEILYPTKQNNSQCSNDEMESIKRPENTCMCSTLAARLNVKDGGRSCCCRGGEKKDAETYCDLKKEFKQESNNKNSTGIQTDDDLKYKRTVIATNVSTIVKIKSKETKDCKEDHVTKIAPRSIQTCIMQEMSKKMMLHISNDKVSNKKSKRDVKSSMRLESDTLANVLQSNETKKAVLEIYAEKVITGEGTHTIAKLPKYVISRESKILEYIGVNKKLSRKDTVTMDFFR